MIAQSEIPFDQLLGPYGLVVALIIAVYVMGKFFNRYVKKLEEERDYWQHKAIDLLETASSAVNTAVRLAPEKNIREMAAVVDEARRRGDLP